MKPKETRNLLFDLGNVIIDIDIEGAHDRLKKLFKKDASPELIEQAFLSYECGKISTDIFINTLLGQSERKVQALDIIEAWNSMLVGIPSYRLEMLDKVRSGYNVYLLSNTNALHLEWIHHHVSRIHRVEQFENRYFDHAFYSHVIGDRKPNPSIFKFIMEDAHMIPGYTLFMDDMKDNIEVARQLGFCTYLVKPGEEIAEYLKLEGYY